MRTVRRAVVPLLIAAWAACVCDEHRPDADRRVVIDNRSGEVLNLMCAMRDAWQSPRPLGDGPTLALSLPPGRYAIQLGDDPARRVPLPLPAAELGHVPAVETRLVVAPWPAAEPGWCWIPAGPAMCGDDLGVGREDERPLRVVATPGFWLAERETSNAQFAAFLNAVGREAVDPDWLDFDGSKCRVRWSEPVRAFVTDAPDLPVVTVSWPGAVAYCEWRTATTGLHHRLPHEHEWEKAARGPGSRVYAYGDTFRVDAANQESGHLRAIGAFDGNGFGLCDMTGNAFEWTTDAYADAPAGPRDREQRMLRGGSFVLDGIFVRNSMRMRLRPGVRADDVGFRVLREASTDAESR